jgi:hypothetical protein
MKLIKNNAEFSFEINYQNRLEDILKSYFEEEHSHLIVNNENISKLITTIDLELIYQLNNYNEVITERQLSKHSSRYIRIKKNDHKYVINYRTNELGNYIYLLNELLLWLMK